MPIGKDDATYRRAMRAAGREPHPATMPASVARFCIKLASQVEDVVYDPFAGSGTTVVEAIKAGRRGLGSERSRTYLEGALIRAQTASLELDQVA
jgi:DNA modification methylase